MTSPVGTPGYRAKAWLTPVSVECPENLRIYLLVASTGQHYPLSVGHSPLDENLLTSLLFDGLGAFTLLTPAKSHSTVRGISIEGENISYRSFSRIFSP